jgi:glycosyltransferase involved in cell wall biosynthesis
MKISIISTCKSRLKYLKQALPSWIAFQPFEIIVVDVKCPDGTSDWLRANHPDVRILEHSRDGFNKPEALNIGAREARGDVLFFVDADIILGSGFHNWIRTNWPRDGFLVRARNDAYDGVHEQGTVLCRKSDFQKVDGYDEAMEGYGGEDHDFFNRLMRAGVRRLGAPKSFISSIEHDDAERTQNYRIKDKNAQIVISRVYRAAKESLLRNRPDIYELPFQTRREIWSVCERTLGERFDAMSEKGPITVKLEEQKWLPEPYFAVCEININLTVRKRQ